MKINRRGCATLPEILLLMFIVVIALLITHITFKRFKEADTRKPDTLVPQQKSALSFTIEERVLILGTTYEIVRHNPTGVKYVVNNHTFTQLTNPDGSPFIGNK